MTPSSEPHKVASGNREFGLRDPDGYTLALSRRSEMDRYTLRPANHEDAADVTEVVRTAYEHYIERIGMPPGPMTEDYVTVIRDRQVTVAEAAGTITGVILLGVDDEGFVIQNVAVHPSHRGKGLGRALLEHAEAEAVGSGFDAIHLYTHEKMTENLALYSRLGYIEYDRAPKVISRSSTCASPLAEWNAGAIASFRIRRHHMTMGSAGMWHGVHECRGPVGQAGPQAIRFVAQPRCPPVTPPTAFATRRTPDRPNAIPSAS
jgi:ribosomal protein S18 acetylase RimI-like enzyme